MIACHPDALHASRSGCAYLAPDFVSRLGCIARHSSLLEGVAQELVVFAQAQVRGSVLSLCILALSVFPMPWM